MKAQTPLRFAFGYQARVGKDTAANYLKSLHGGTILSFAQAIYDIMYFAQRTCGFKEEKDRHFLQYIGTQWAREKEPDVWLNVVLRKIESLPKDEPIYITDVRFPNEFDALEKIGFTLINIKRDDALRESLGSGSSQHASETALIPYTLSQKWHWVIINNWSLEHFQKSLEEAVIYVSCWRQPDAKN